MEILIVAEWWDEAKTSGGMQDLIKAYFGLSNDCLI